MKSVGLLGDTGEAFNANIDRQHLRTWPQVHPTGPAVLLLTAWQRRTPSL
jgi:hypothetical protein